MAPLRGADRRDLRRPGGEQLSTRCDVAVVGLGVMGLAAAEQLARRGRRVVGIEQHQPLHTRGSSHGAARIFRLAYEHDDYVRLAAEALPLWRDLEERSGTQVMTLTGSVDFGNTNATRRITAALARNDVTHEVLHASAARDRWPGIAFTGEVLYSPVGGRTDADAARTGLQQLALDAGADLRFDTRVVSVSEQPHGVRVETSGGDVDCAVAVVTVNAWAATLLDGVVALPPLQVTQEQPVFFAPRDPAMEWPSFIHYTGDATLVADFGSYGLASPAEGGVKVGEHGTGIPLTDLDGDRPAIDPRRIERVSRYVAEHLPGLDPQPLAATPCVYAITPSEDFVIDRSGNLVVGVGFSGHGFKFAPAIGRLLADLAGGSGVAPARFRLQHHRPRT